MQDGMQERTAKMEAVNLIGFIGDNLDDQHRLFSIMEEKIGQIIARKSDDQYLVILPGLFPFVGVEVNELNVVPDGMIAYLIPEDEYVIFRFEERHIGDFWDSICTIDNQIRYNIDLSKPRYEIFTSNLQSAGFTEWYIPTKS